MDKKRGQVDLSLREPGAASAKVEAGALVNGQITHVSGAPPSCYAYFEQHFTPFLLMCAIAFLRAAQMQRALLSVLPSRSVCLPF